MDNARKVGKIEEAMDFLRLAKNAIEGDNQNVCSYTDLKMAEQLIREVKNSFEHT